MLELAFDTSLPFTTWIDRLIQITVLCLRDYTMHIRDRKIYRLVNKSKDRLVKRKKKRQRRRMIDGYIKKSTYGQLENREIAQKKVKY